MGKDFKRLGAAVVLAALALVAVWFMPQFEAAATVAASNVTTAPTVDGNLSESSWNIATGVSKIISGTPNNTATFGVLWNSSSLFVGVKVLDASLRNDSANAWDDDSVEIYLDANHNHGTSYDTNDRQIVKGYNDTGIWVNTGNTTGISHGWASVSGGYSTEVSVTWASLGVMPSAGSTIGFDIGNNDDDDGSARDSQLMWEGTNYNWTDTSAFGDCYLEAAAGSTPTSTATPTNTPTNTPTPSPTAGTVTAKKTLSSLTIDGNLNEAVWSIAAGVAKTISGTPNNTATFGTLWDDTRLYVGVKVLDGNLYNDSTNAWDDDSVEIYLDANHNHGTSYDSYDRQIVKGYNDTAVWVNTGNTTGIAHGWASVSGGYSAEVSVAWASLSVTPAAGNTIGFDIGVNDDDNGSGRDSQLMWTGTDLNWTDTSSFGDCYLSAETVSDGATPTATPTNTPTPTITITPTPSNAIIGNTSEGAVTDTTTANYYNAFRYQASANMTVNEIKIKIASANTGRLKCAIYSDSGGNAANFLVGTEERSNLAAGWQVLRLTNSYNLTGGSYYWLVNMKDSNYAFSATTVTGSNAWAALTYGNWPSILPAKQGTADTQHCFYAYYNPSQPPIPTPSSSPSSTPTPSPTISPGSDQMYIGANFWNITWGSGWSDYFAGGVNWSTTTNPWNPTFVNELIRAKYKCLRFMDWVPTNNSSITSWSQRTLPTSDHYSGPEVAYEWQIDLCNRIGADIWVTIPHAANWDYSYQLANLLQSRLNSARKIYIEWSNEVWNWGFSQTTYADNQSTVVGIRNIDVGAYCEPWWKYKVYASVRVWEQFERVFGTNSPRLVKVIGDQVGYHWDGYNINHMTTAELACLQNSTINPNGITPNCFAAAPYAGGTSVSQQYSNLQGCKDGLMYMRNSLAGTPYKLLCYEGGTDNYSAPDQLAVQRDPAQYQFHIDYWNAMDDYTQGIFCQYTHVGQCWGLKVYTGESDANAPKWRGTLAWIDARY